MGASEMQNGASNNNLQIVEIDESNKEDAPLSNGHATEMSNSHNPRSNNRFIRFLRENLFLVVNVIGILLGFIIGLVIRPFDPTKDAIMWIGMCGELYLRILKCIILPLIVCTVIDGTASSDPKTNGKLGLIAMIYILCWNTLGAVMGAVLGVVFKPGSGLEREQGTVSVDTRNLKTVDVMADFIRNIFPPNMIGAAVQVSQTKYTSKEVTTLVNISGQLVNETTTSLVRSVGTVGSTNILGIIVISAALGIAASQSGQQAKPFINFFKAGAAVIFKLFSWIKWTTPLGSASLIAASLAGLNDLGGSLKSIGTLCIINTVANLVILQIIVLGAFFFFTWRQNPLKFYIRAARAWLMAFGAISSAVPYAEYLAMADEFRVRRRVSEYVLPLCVTLNRGGSALFVTLTCLFVAQYEGHSLDGGTVIVIVVLGLLSSLAIPAVNSASIVSIIIILESLGIGSANSGVIGLVLAMDWLNDRIRTTTNCLSYCTCVLTTWRFSKQDLCIRDDGDEEDAKDKVSQC